jgi:hypothetical protein
MKKKKIVSKPKNAMTKTVKKNLQLQSHIHAGSKMLPLP